MAIASGAGDTPAAEAHVALMWTGGWDSTFLLLRSLIDERLHVTPYYLLDADRPSVQVELVTMRRIRERILTEHPSTRALFAPTRYHAVPDIAPAPEITAARTAIVKTRHLGTQWDWLPRFCKEHELNGIRIGVHGGDRAFAALHGMMTRGQGDDDPRQGAAHDFRVDPRFAATDEYKLFGRLTFPLFDLTKPDMGEVAQARGWSEILEMTWFCHDPRGGCAPCGKCAACRGVIVAGMARRIPARSRALARFETAVTDPVKASAKGFAQRMAQAAAGGRARRSRPSRG
jgi:hypothetical protein